MSPRSPSKNPVLQALDIAKKTVSLAQTQDHHEPNPHLERLGREIDMLEEKTTIAPDFERILIITELALKDDVLFEHLCHEMGIGWEELLHLKKKIEEYQNQ